MNVDDLRFLYDYNQWATRRKLDDAAKLTVDQLQRDLATSHGSVFGTLSHMLWWEWRWLGRCMAPAEAVGSDPVAALTLDQLRIRWAELERIQTQFVADLTEAELNRPVRYENPPGTSWTYPLTLVLQHVVNHSTYHRGQITTLVRQLGCTATPTDILYFVDALDAAETSARSKGD
jgi:uncharacterized damage-inducible protein DinB